MYINVLHGSTMPFDFSIFLQGSLKDSPLMVFGTRALSVVYKNTGGRLWNKPWGLPSPTSTQKANRRKQRQDEQSVAAVLKEAAAKEPKSVSSTKQKQ